jgi:hypothetical protein
VIFERIWGYIPVIIQNARFRVLEQFQFEARQLDQGYSLFLWRNNKMILLKLFFDGDKNDLYVVIDFEKDATWM